MIPFHKSIGFRLLGISFILLAIPLLVDSFILVRARYNRTVEDAKLYLAEIANFREIPLSQLHPLSRSLIELLVHDLNLETHFPEKSTPDLNKQLKNLAKVGQFHGISLLKITPDDQYIIIDSSLPGYEGKDYTFFYKSYNLFSHSAAEKGFSSVIAFDDKTLKPYFIATHTIYSKQEGRYVGLLTVIEDINLKIGDLLQAETEKYPINFALMLPSTIVFASTDPSLNLHYFLPLKESALRHFQTIDAGAAKQLPSKPIAIKSDTTFPFFEFSWKGTEYIGYVNKMAGANYALLAYAAKNDVFKAPLIDFFNIYTGYGIILVIGGTLATLATLRMTKPIQDLSVVMQKIQEGDLGLRYQRDPLGFEINVLGDIFNEMIDAVLEQQQIAEAQRVKREIFARELRLGREVQENLLPHQMPQYSGIDVAAIYIPAIEVAGDFFDTFVTQKGDHPKLALTVADASGKGVQACLYSLSVKNMLRTYTHVYGDIAKAMGATNDLICADTGDTGMFVTALSGLYDNQSRILSYFSSGHNPGYIRRQNGTIETLHSAGIAMGVLPAQEETAFTIQLHIGDTIVFYTDGVTEAQNTDSQFFGTTRLENCLRQTDMGARDLAHAIADAVSQFTGTAPQYDDITLLVMKVTE